MTAAAAAAVLCGGGVSAVAAVTSLPPIPSVPGPPAGDPLAFPDGVQPSVPASSCTLVPLRPGEIRPIYSWRSPSGTVAGMATVDPWNPCHLYRAMQPSGGDPAGIQRGDVVHGTVQWRRVFVDNAAATPPLPVVGSANPGSTMPDLVTMAAPGRPYFQVVGGVGGLRHSGDAGWHWDHRDGGLIPMGEASSARSGASPYPGAFLAFAVTDPDIGLLFFTGDGLVHVTHDGGGSWDLVPLPATQVAAVAIDPLDASRMVVVDQTALASAQQTATAASSTQVMWQSDDAGAHWSAQLLTGLTGPVTRLLLAHSAGRPLEYVCAVQEPAGMRWFARADGSPQWQPLALPVTPQSALAIDPVDPGVMVWAGADGTALQLQSSSNDFTTPATLRRRLALPRGWSLQELSLQADRRSDFFLYWRLLNVDGVNNGLQSEDMVAFQPAALQGTGTLPIETPPPPPPPTAQQPSRIDRTCAVPTGAAQPRLSGDLTFDGRFLDYTEDGLGVTTGVILRLDTATCQPAPPLTLRAADFPGGTVPTLYELSYQPEYVFADGTPGAILAAGAPNSDARVPSGDAPIYAVNPDSGAASLLLGTEVAGMSQLGDGIPLFSYDIFRDGLWAIGQGTDGSVDAGFLSWDGVLHRSCMTDFANPFTGFGSGDSSSGGVASWTVGADGILYVQMEDDTSTFRVDDRTCRVIDGFHHVNLGEPADENEQLACDAITFGSGGDGHSVLWIRNVVSSTAVAYQIPDGYCPFPTQLTYDGDTLASLAAPVTLCATLRAETAGTREALPGQDVAFTLDGSPRGTGHTDAGGRACVHTTAPAVPGPHAVTGVFAGTRAYLPSRAQGVLVTVGVPAVHGGRITPAFPVTVSSAGEPPPAPSQTQPQAETAAQVQVDTVTQAQAQAQAQTQSVAQSQPGMMLQRQPQRQVAAQTVTRRNAHAAALLATQPAPARAPRWSAAAMAAVVMMLGLGCAAPRPRRVEAWGRRRR